MQKRKGVCTKQAALTEDWAKTLDKLSSVRRECEELASFRGSNPRKSHQTFRTPGKL